MELRTSDKRRRRTRRILSSTALGAVLLWQSVWTSPQVWTSFYEEGAPQSQVAAAAVSQSFVRLIEEEPVTAGATLRTYEYVAQRGNETINTTARVIVVDLQEPYVDLSVMSGVQGNLHTKQTVLGMAKETGAVAGINGDYFHMSLDLPPIGPVIDDGEMKASPLFAEGYYMFGISKSKEPVIDFYRFEGEVTAEDGYTFPIRGMNRAATWSNGVLSHVDSIFMYTSDWGTLDRGDDPNYTHNEILVVDGVVKEMVFNDTLPMLVPENGVILRVNREAAQFFKEHVQVGDELQIEYDLVPTDASNSVHGNDLDMLIGGHTLLVKDGSPSAYTTDVSGIGGARSRTGIGYSKDGRYVYMITADNATGSDGMTVSELQDFMVLIGVWKGMNLDGGGSTQLVSRPLGEEEVQLTNQPEFGSMRSVSNGIGVYTSAPAGELKGLVLYGPEYLFMQEEATYTAKAYDTYYNPMDASELPIQWTVTDGDGADDDAQVKPTKRGMATVTATLGQVQESMQIPVVGRQDLSELTLTSSSGVFAAGNSYDLSVYATSRDGVKREVPSEALQWEFRGFNGTLDGSTLTVQELTDPSKVQLIASYDGFSTMLTLPAGQEKLWTNFESWQPEIGFTGYPSTVSGWAKILSDVHGTGADNESLVLNYDFYEGDQVTKAAYVTLNGDQGIEIEGEPIWMNMKLLGDNSLNWARAMFVDAEGKQHLVDIAKGINWYGFKEVSADLSAYDMTYPITLKRLYLASPVERQEERGKFGVIAFDDISFFSQGQLPEIDKPMVELTIDQKQLYVDGEARELDQAPIIRNDTTLIPVRFIVDALQGEVYWDGTEQKVTLIKNNHLIEMWIGDAELLIDGKRVTSPVAPQLINDRTMVPLRLVADAFGWEVGWDEIERKVTLK